MKIKQKIKQKIRFFLEVILNEINKNNTISISNKIPPSAEIISSCLNGDIKIGERAFIYKCEMFGNISIGNNTSVYGPNTDIHCKLNYVKIGNFCSIARNVSIQEYNHKINTATSYFIKNHIFNEDCTKEISSKGNIEIGNDVWIGENVTIMPGVKIGDGAIIAANSTVVKDVDPYTITGGNPAAAIKKRFSDEIIKLLLEIQWWNWEEKKIFENVEELVSANDIDTLKKLCIC